MKLTLTPTQAETLKRAPNTWEPLPANVCISSLRLRGLVAVRDAPGPRCLTLGFQWKITLTGFCLEHRKIQPIPEPEVLAIHKPARITKISA